MISRLWMVCLVCSLGPAACSDDDARLEGAEPGDCADGADNDSDGLFDCNDPGCQGAPACIGPEAGRDGAVASDAGIVSTDAKLGNDASHDGALKVSDSGFDAGIYNDASRGDGGVAIDASVRDATGPPWDGGGGCDPAPAATTCSGSFTQTYVLSTVDSDVAQYNDQGDPTSSLGFDLDCTSGLSCRCINNCQDLPEIAGVDTVDNQFAYLGPVFEQALSLNSGFGSAVTSGKMLLVVKLEGLDAAANQSIAADDCVDVAVYPAKTADNMPPMTAAGALKGGQSFVALGEYLNINDQPLLRGRGSVNQGELSVRLPRLPVTAELSSDLEFELLDVTLRVGLGSTTEASGEFAGGIDVLELLAAFNMVQAGLGDPGTLVANLLYAFADLVPSQANGACTRISTTMKFDAVNASLSLP